MQLSGTGRHPLVAQVATIEKVLLSGMYPSLQETVISVPIENCVSVVFNIIVFESGLKIQNINEHLG